MDMPEMLICSAIRVPDRIFLGERHSDCYHQMQQAGLYLPDLAYIVEGFATSRNRFVTRFEAAKIAKAANQLPADSPITQLYSKDIWPERK